MAGEGSVEVGSPQPFRPPRRSAFRRQPRTRPGTLLVPLLPGTGYSSPGPVCLGAYRGVWRLRRGRPRTRVDVPSQPGARPPSRMRGGGRRTSAVTPRRGLSFPVVPAAKKAGQAVSEMCPPPEGNGQRSDTGRGRRLCPRYPLICALHRGEVF